MPIDIEYLESRISKYESNAKAGDAFCQYQLSEWYRILYELTNHDNCLELAKFWREEAERNGYVMPENPFNTLEEINQGLEKFRPFIKKIREYKVGYAKLLEYKAVKVKDITLLDEAEKLFKEAAMEDNSFQDMLDDFLNNSKTNSLKKITDRNSRPESE